MSSMRIQMNGNGQMDIDQIARALEDGISGELISESWRDLNGNPVALLCFEKYYFRNGGCASLTVLLTQAGKAQTVDIIGTAGGTGLLNISWGANSAFAKEAAKILHSCGFSEESRRTVDDF